ncbi:Putative transposase of IS4/5 family (DUF4096) [Abditibacterium utsteinense]|uniref:Transposase of IS4/5 family (DUF4096) n=1 Tax=Abditibacterium utsteinense TaxID=1960156 RepID=A0A2S8SUV2_9BACT|nr:Putative transposase of IS4/5 family (DUF4096) [Abditibacterium utsteinense]
MPRRAKPVSPSDLSDAQWSRVAPVLRSAVGRSGSVPRRDVLNAIFSVLRTGCQWRDLPQSYPNWKTVDSCFRRMSKRRRGAKTCNSCLPIVALPEKASRPEKASKGRFKPRPACNSSLWGADAVGCQVLPKRWLIEQVFGCWGRNRRLSRGYEQQLRHSRVKHSQTTLQIASIHRFLNRSKSKLQPPTSRYKCL